MTSGAFGRVIRRRAGCVIRCTSCGLTIRTNQIIDPYSTRSRYTCVFSNIWD
ncbi:hypothetical protein VPHD479_0268 [Vibrio phage D479]